MSQPFPHLFTPIQIGKKQAPNRVMRVGTTTSTGRDGVPSDHTIAIYRRLARGGTGIIVTESMRVHGSNPGRNETAMHLYRPEIVPHLSRLADAVRAEGDALIIAQMNHGGRQHHNNFIPMLWAPSPIACPHSGGVPHQMSKSDIAAVVEGFVRAAGVAKKAGLDGVEIHGAQGHLIQEFISPFSNQRDDEYGGSLENRMRIARDIAIGIRQEVGPDFVVGYRMGIAEFSPGGIDIEMSKELTARLVALGAIDYFSLVQGNFNSIDTHVPDTHYPPAPFADLQAQLRTAAAGVPIVASSRIVTPEQAEHIVAHGKADMVGLCRALIADPEWPLKAREGRAEDNFTSKHCSQFWGGGSSRPLHCTVHPKVGQELDPLTRVADPKRVVVVGGGPAGLEAAATAAERGHRVVLIDKRTALGGKLSDAQQFQPYNQVSEGIDYLIRRVRKAGVEVRAETTATCDAVLAEKPDAVIVAAGSQPYTPTLPGDGSVRAVLSSSAPAGATVVVMDEDGFYWSASVTEQLARRGCKVWLVTRFLEPLREIPEVNRISTLRALDQLDVKLRPNMFVERAENGAVFLRHYYNSEREERIDGVADVVWLGPQRPEDGLAHEFKARSFANVQLVGDAFMPRRLEVAMAEGHRAARRI